MSYICALHQHTHIQHIQTMHNAFILNVCLYHSVFLMWLNGKRCIFAAHVYCGSLDNVPFCFENNPPPPTESLHVKGYTHSCSTWGKHSLAVIIQLYLQWTLGYCFAEQNTIVGICAYMMAWKTASRALIAARCHSQSNFAREWNARQTWSLALQLLQYKRVEKEWKRVSDKKPLQPWKVK